VIEYFVDIFIDTHYSFHKMNATNILYSFNFTGGGINSTWAPETATLEQIKTSARRSIGDWADKIDPSTIKPLRTEAEQNAYWESLPLMD
jgi:hypothetical protein